MPKFNVSISFSLRTEIEPEGIYFDRNAPEGAEDVEDNSYWRRADVEADGGNVTFVAECEDEDAARTLSEEFVYDGQEWTDDMGFAWMVDDVSVEIEEIEEPMTLDRAKEIVRVWLDGRDEEDDLSEALDFLFSEFDRLGSKVAELGSEVATLSSALRDAERKLAECAGEIDRLRNGPDGSEAPTV